VTVIALFLGVDSHLAVVEFVPHCLAQAEPGLVVCAMLGRRRFQAKRAGEQLELFVGERFQASLRGAGCFVAPGPGGAGGLLEFRRGLTPAVGMSA
jgi:hypothetical protein